MNLTNFDLDELLGLGPDSNPLLMLIWIAPIVVFVFYGQRIQLMVTSGEIRKGISKLEKYRDESHDQLALFVKERAGPGHDEKIAAFLDYFTIMPVDMDPAGIVGKVRHFVRSREDYTRRHVESLSPGMDEYAVSQIQTMLEIASTLQLLHRIVNHFYLTAKKQKNFPLILPLQMMLPQIMENAAALSKAVPAFRAGQPIGDGIGPMVVGKMMLNSIKNEAAFQTVWGKSELEGRKLYLLKARGPLSTVGRIGDAIKGLLSENHIDAIVMIDAALRMEGEESATIARGFGAAIGGIGVERFLIEEEAVSRNIPVFAVIIKQTIGEALGLMSRPIADAAVPAGEQVRQIILENTKAGQSVLIIGVGNTMGVSQ